MAKARIFLIAALLGAISAGSFAADTSATRTRDSLKALNWQQGPTTSVLEGKSTLVIPKGVSFLDEKEGSKFLEITGNLAASESIVVAGGWWAAFSFNGSGYVNDDEKIDADALLASIKASDDPGNVERRKLGLTELHTEGWYIPPHYDTTTKRLEWALRLRAGDSPEPVLNYTVRLLGRRGYESVVLVSSPQTLDADVLAFKQLLTGFSFSANEGYSEFKAGDHVAEFGLGALIVGGAAAVIAKTGFWKIILGFLVAGWKVIAVAGVGLFAGIGKLLGRKKTD